MKDEHLIFSVIVGAAIIIETLIGASYYTSYLARRDAFEAGYCQVYQPGSGLLWQKCRPCEAGGESADLSKSLLLGTTSSAIGTTSTTPIYDSPTLTIP